MDNNITSDKIIFRIRNYLKENKKAKTDIDAIGGIFDGSISYEEFAKAVISLINDEILTGNKKNGNNHKQPSIPYKYKVNLTKLKEDYYKSIGMKQLQINPIIKLDKYYKLNEKTFYDDLNYIDIINAYINQKDITKEEKLIPELSFELVGDEKWIEEKGGKKILNRLQLWDKFSFSDRIEPLAFAIDINKVNKATQYHLILENKTPYNFCIDAIEESIFTTIIYGKGWQVTSSINLFEKQINTHCENIFLYFGDIDYAGISIWHSLNQITTSILAMNFYKSMLQLDSNSDKENQKASKSAVDDFTAYFCVEDKEKILTQLELKKCYPQEILSRGQTVALLTSITC